jgi:hypothetical protein
MPRTPTTRSHGEGSIYRSDYTRRGSGVTVERWIASVDVGVGPHGERLRKKITGPTRKAVADKLRELRREQDAGVDLRQKSMTVADVARAWLTHLDAAHHGHRVLFATAVDWVARLQDAHRLGRLPAELARLRRYGLIIIDLCRGRDYADRRRGGGR